MKKQILLRLDPWSQLALWLIVLLLVADRIKSIFPISTAQAQDSGMRVVDVNLAQVGGSKVNPENGIPVRQAGPPPTTRVGPGNFPFQKTE